MLWENSVEQTVAVRKAVASCEDAGSPCYCDNVYGCSTRRRWPCTREACDTAGEAMEGVPQGLLAEVKEVCLVSGGVTRNFTFHGCTRAGDSARP